MSAARTEGSRARRPGDRLGRKLELVSQLGEGGMGALWLARNLATEAEVAVKVLRSDRERDGHAAERFRHEAQLGAMLTHRNITRVFDLLEDDDGSLVLVMELLHGQTLEAAYKQRGSLSCREAVAVVVPILGALQHAHERGVVHRDVKPSNIFLHVDPDGHITPKLLDFGIAKTHDASVLTRTGDALGSPSYMSPEQVRAAKQLDGRSDLFSVGVVLYEIITGENPFHAPSPTASLAHVLELDVDPDPRIEPRLWLEIQRALAKQPYERHASAANLADALSRAVGASPADSVRGLVIAGGIEVPRSQPRPVPARPAPGSAERTTDDARSTGEGPTEDELAADDHARPVPGAVASRAARPLLLACALASVLAAGAVVVLRAGAEERDRTAATAARASSALLPSAPPAPASLTPSAPATTTPATTTPATTTPASSTQATTALTPAGAGTTGTTGTPGTTGAPPRHAGRGSLAPSLAAPTSRATSSAPSAAPSVARTPGF